MPEGSLAMGVCEAPSLGQGTMGAALFGTLDDGVHTRALDNSNTSRDLTQAVMPMARMPGKTRVWDLGEASAFQGKRQTYGV